jgi:ABC-2 type transport system ATP-binding protein
MLKIRGLKKSYKGYAVLKGLDMTVERGEVYGFIGKNGIGKTTTMNIICNQLRKDGGDVEINGGKPYKIGYLPETPNLYGYMSAREYLNYVAACGAIQNADNKVGELLSLVKLENTGNKRIKGYSRGMNQRLGIAAVLLNDPDLLILDEPTSALDPEGRADVVSIIGNIRERGATIILCTHILSDIERTAGKIGVISDGVIKAEGTLHDIIRSVEGTPRIAVRLSDEDKAAYSDIMKLPLVIGTDENRNGGFVYTPNTPENSKALCAAILGLLSEKHITPERVEIAQPTLEQAYFKIIGGNQTTTSNVGLEVTK